MNEENEKQRAIQQIAATMRRCGILLEMLCSGEQADPYDVWMLSANMADDAQAVHRALVRGGIASLDE